jgi:hypothetical protein
VSQPAAAGRPARQIDTEKRAGTEPRSVKISW